MNKKPLVSIIIATYNAPHLLQYAIKSVLNSDHSDWELIIIGDGCSQPTADCIESFADNRITYENLPKNTGGQSAPNNHGLKISNGDIIMYLNQDDMYLSNHISNCINILRNDDASILLTPYIVIEKTNREFETHQSEYWDVNIRGVSVNNTYMPHGFYVASSWAMTKNATIKMGLWPCHTTCHVTPSQELLFQSSKKDIEFRYNKNIGVIVIFSGLRDDSYLNKFSVEHKACEEQLTLNPQFKEMLFEKAAITLASKLLGKRLKRPFFQVFQILTYPLTKLVQKFNIHPSSIKQIIKGGRKGAQIKKHREKVGL
jgi:glycosyltransferase involved in cell wall biosynthesis